VFDVSCSYRIGLLFYGRGRLVGSAIWGRRSARLARTFVISFLFLWFILVQRADFMKAINLYKNVSGD